MDTSRSRSLLVPSADAEELKKASLSYPSLVLNHGQMRDLELLLTGAFAPLSGFLDRRDFDAVLADMRLSDGTLWPMPTSLDAPAALAESLSPGDKLALRDHEGFMLAVLTVTDVWPANPVAEARAIFGTTADDSHPGALDSIRETGAYHIGGTVEGISLPLHADFPDLRHTPDTVRAACRQRGWRTILGCQSVGVLHSRDRAMLQRAAGAIGANILLLPVAGDALTGGAEHFCTVRCAMHFAADFPRDGLMTSLLPLRLRQAGPRQALAEAIIQKNYGCTHSLVTPRHADPFPGHAVPPCYPEGAAQELVARHAAETGIAMVPCVPMEYVVEQDRYLPTTDIVPGMTVKHMSPEECTRRLEFDLEIPAWHTPPAITAELRAIRPPRSRQGFTLFMTGLSGAGKSTLAKILYVKFMELRSRPVTLLDGDIVRRNLSSELTFSKQHRNLNITRIGFVASEITKNGGIAICAPIAPYASSRADARALVAPYGGFIEIHVATPLAVCEQRDRKGLYAKARSGIIKGVTGVDDPYEAPTAPEIHLDTSSLTPGEAARDVMLYLERQGYLA